MIGLAYRGIVLGEVQGWLPASGTLVRRGDRPRKVKLSGKYKATKKIVVVLNSWVQHSSIDAPLVVLVAHLPEVTPGLRQNRKSRKLRKVIRLCKCSPHGAACAGRYTHAGSRRRGAAATPHSSAFLRRLRATCRRRLMVPMGVSNSRLICLSERPRM